MKVYGQPGAYTRDEKKQALRELIAEAHWEQQNRPDDGRMIPGLPFAPVLVQTEWRLQLGDALQRTEALELLDEMVNGSEPTDDEREALIELICSGFDRPDYYQEEPGIDGVKWAADAVLAAGFRRTEVPEPSVCFNCGQTFVDGDLRAQYVGRGYVHQVACPKPQGEPSDALADAVGGVIYSGHQEDRNPYEIARDVLAVVGKVTRRSCTPSADACRAGGDTLVYAVADWIAAGGVP